jgi:hypothetical protein
MLAGRLKMGDASHADARPRRNPRGRYGGIRQELAAAMTKKRRTYQLRIVGDKVMMPADLKRLHKYMLEIEHISVISDEMRTVVEENGRSSSISCRRSRSTNFDTR